MFLQQKNIKIGKSKIESAGYGVFAEESIEVDEIICECPMLEDTSSRDDYYFSFNNKKYLPLGFGLLINHSDNPNCRWQYEGNTLKFFSIKNINKGEEIFYDYGRSYNYKKYFRQY